MHREAGATEVLVASGNRWALMHEHRGAPEPDSKALMKHMSDVDLLLVEGFKRESHAKLEIFREANGKPLLAAADPNIVAILVDGPKPATNLPVIDLNDIGAIADFVIRHCGFSTR